MSKYNYIIFDFDKTICELSLDWDKLKKQLSKHIEKIYGDKMNFTPIDQNLNLVNQKYGGAELLRLYGVIGLFETNGGYRNINDIIIKFVKQNRSKHFAIYSMNMTTTIKKCLNELGLDNKFDIIIGKDNCLAYKPSGKDIDFIIEKWNIKPSDTLFVGDSESDFISGKAAGVDTFIL